MDYQDPQIAAIYEMANPMAEDAEFYLSLAGSSIWVVVLDSTQLPALFQLLEEEPQPGCAFERLECPEFCA
jgi:hypothetical protein